MFHGLNCRYQLNCKKNKIDANRKASKYSVQQLSTLLCSISNNEDFKDDVWPLSKSLVSGSMNNCKTRIINFLQQDRALQGLFCCFRYQSQNILLIPSLKHVTCTGNVVSIVPRLHSRMVMSMKPTDGTVAMHYGDLDEGEILAAEDYLPTLPNTVSSYP